MMSSLHWFDTVHSALLFKCKLFQSNQTEKLTDNAARFDSVLVQL